MNFASDVWELESVRNATAQVHSPARIATVLGTKINLPFGGKEAQTQVIA